MNFDSMSILMIWTAIAIYAAAFIAYALDLGKRSQVASDARFSGAESGTADVRELVGAAVGGSSGGAARASRTAAANLSDPTPQRFVMARIGTALATLGFLFHLAGEVLRGIAAGRVPWSNMYEFAMTGTLLIVAVYLAVNLWFDLKFLGTFILGLVVVLLGGAATGFYVQVVPLSDPLKSVWLVIHVFVASLGTAFFALAFALSVFQLLQVRRETKAIAGAEKPGPRFLKTLPVLRAAGGPRLPVRDHRLHLLDVHAHRGRDLGQRRLGQVLGLRHQGDLDLHHLGALRRLHPRQGDARLARIPLRLACDRGLQRGAVQLHDREHVLQGSARLLRPELSLPPAAPS